MFGNSKPFGTASAFGASTFGNTSTPFGQSTTAFGAKPATNNVFGSTAFGVPAASTPMSGGLFGSSTPTTGAGLFGQPTPAFGAPASTSSGAFGGFGAASTSGGLFGSNTPSTQSTGGLFGSTSTSAFGTPRPAFGSFGATSTGTGLFGQNTSTGSGLFGSTGVGGFSSTVQTGTTIKFNPPTGTDTMMKGGVSTSIGTRHQCITCMKEYENKSLEELRVEDYAANRKGGAPATGIGFGATQPAAGGLFGGSAAAASTSAFTFGGTTQSKPLFGTTGMTNTFGSTNTGLFGQTAQNQNSGLFGKSVGFGAPSTSTAPAFSFGGTNNSLFGQNNQQKPLFGQTTGTTGLFGSPATSQSTGFGNNTSFGGFGTTNQSGGLFGAKPTGFGTTNTTTTNTFSFGNTSGGNMSGGLFGQKPTAPAFGTTGFGAQTSGFGAFGTTPSTGTNLFGQSKPATSGFGTTGNLFGGGLSTGFGAPSAFSMGGLGSSSSTGLFGNTTANKPTGFAFGNTGSTGFNFGSTNPSTSTFNFGTTPTQMPSSDFNNSQALQQIQQQILALTANPFGDSPLFRNSIQDSSREAEVLKPTNPSAQKALLNDSQYKVDLLPTAKIKPKPWSPSPSGKVFLFDGLEDEEPSLGAAAFVPKRSIKKLVLKNIGNTKSSLTLTSDVSSNQPTRIDVSISLKSPQNQLNKTSGEPRSSSTPLTSDVSKILMQSDTEKRLPNASGEQQLSPPKSNTLDKEVTSPKTFQDIFDDSIAALHTNTPRFPNQNYNMWSDSTDEVRNFSLEESLNSPSDAEAELKSHPTGLILTKSSYYTVPSKNELIHLLDDKNNCFVENFTIGRKGYGNVVFPGVTNVYGLNLDEIVCFQNKEITVYPDDEKKPPIGEELNKRAQVTLENVWPTDKTTHTLIKDPERLEKMGYKEKIKNCSIKLGATFIDYIPETGSWIFEVEHFSKYGLEDSDEEMDVSKPLDNKTTKNQIDSNGIAKLHSKPTLIQKSVTLTQQDQDMEITVPQLQTPHLDFMSDLSYIHRESRLVDFSKPIKPLFSSVIDSERIQDMKASFFEDDMDDAFDSPLYGGKKDSFFHQQKEMLSFGSPLDFRAYDSASKDVFKKKTYNFEADVDPLQSPFKKHADASLQNSLIESSKPPDRFIDLPIIQNNSQLMPPSIKPMPNVLSTLFLKPFKDSVLHNKQHLIADAGYFMGRSFRVGWDASGVFTSLAVPEEDQTHPVDKLFCRILKPYKTEGMSKPGFTVALHRIPLNSLETESGNKILPNLVEALNLQLKNSVSTSNEGGAPLFVPVPGVESTHELALMFEKQLKDADPLAFHTFFLKQCSVVWNLLVSLWGSVPGLNLDESKANYVTQMARREALSKWLIKTTEQDLNKKIADLSENSYLKKILLFLTGRQTKTAIDVAQKHKDFRLSLLLAQAEGTSVIRKLILRQIINWEQRDVSKYISSDRIAIYALLSGILFWENKHYSVNCCENLNWKQALSLHLWYHCNSNASIQEVISSYDESFKKKYSFPPFPSYLENSSALYDDSITEYDTTYHLLKLYCDRSYRLDLMLMPETYSTDHLDYRLSWFLHLALSSIGYNIPLELSSTINLNFAAQLESLDLWQWAIFVVLHHSDPDMRIKSVKEILLRHVTLKANEEMTEVESFLVESLLVPTEWIFEAKAIRANNVGNKAAEAWYLLKAGFWNKSHDIVMKHLATRAVINEDYDFLLKYLNELLPPKRSCTIQDWNSGGQVYVDYIHVCRVVQEVLKNKTNAYELEKFTPEVISLCRRLSSIPITSMEDSLSISEMAKKTATILRSICMLQATRTQNTDYLTTFTQTVRNLPMPHDYKVPEYRFVTHKILDIISVSQ